MMPMETLKDWIKLAEEQDFANFAADGIDLLKWFVDEIAPDVATFVHRVPVIDVWRLTPNRSVAESLHNVRIDQLSLLKYPPAEKAGYGRANLPGQSVLYGSFSRLSAQLETEPIRGDLVTLTRWQCPVGETIAVAPVVFLPDVISKMPHFEPHYARFEGWLAGMADEEAAYRREVTAFMTKQFMKTVARARPINYFVSAQYANLLLGDERIEAVIFPSVKTLGLDVNIAIRPDIFDRVFVPVEAEEIMVGSGSDGSLWNHRTARTYDFDVANGRVLWGAERSVPEGELPALHEHLEQMEGEPRGPDSE